MPIYNLTGPKSWYKYTSDGLVDHGVLLADSVAAIAGFSLMTTALPPLPIRSKKRHVFIETVSSGKTYRRQVPCPTVDNTLYAAELSQSVTIDGQVWATTGRVGEKFSYPRISP